MFKVTTNKVNSARLKGYAYLQNFFPKNLFIEIHNELDNLQKSVYSSNDLPLRTWWLEDENHFKKIDQVHHCSKIIASFLIKAKFERFLRLLFDTNEVIQIWASSLYICPPCENCAVSAIGVHSDGQYTPFIHGDYYAAWVPLNDVTYSNIVISENAFGSFVEPEVLTPLVQNISNQISQIKSNHNVNFSNIMVTAGDVLFTHSSCLKGVLPNISSTTCSYLVVYFRTEDNKNIHGINHFGMCNYLDDFKLSPIIFHRSLEFCD
jgi:hypothetical protein